MGGPLLVVEPDPASAARGPQRVELLVRSATLVARDVIALELTDPAGGELPAWEAGAHVDVILPSGTVRQYSLCGDLEDRERYRVAILREPESRGGSLEIHDTGLVGKTVGVVGPRNNFALQDDGRYLFLAGGIGITPILSMIQQAQRRGVPWALVYGGRTQERMAFCDELARRDGGRCRIVCEDRDGRPDFDALLRETRSGTGVYCCGPPAMIEAVERVAERELEPGALRIERFVGASVTPEPTGDAGPFEVELAQSGVTLTVPPDRSILDVVLDAVPHQLYSCEEGYCGTCRTRVLAGEPDHRDSVLSDEEREQYMMICVGRSRSARLVLDL